jgi:hypothetical protein
LLLFFLSFLLVLAFGLFSMISILATTVYDV